MRHLSRKIPTNEHKENMKAAKQTSRLQLDIQNSYLMSHLLKQEVASKDSSKQEAMAKLGFTTYLVLVMCTSMMIISTASAQCQGDFQGLIQQCSRFVQRPGPQQTPSQGCCDVVRNVDLPCVCQHVTTQVERIISMQKAAFVSASCGKPLAHGTKCGSYTVP